MTVPDSQPHRLVLIVNGHDERTALISAPAGQIPDLDSALPHADSGDLSHYPLPEVAQPYTDTLREQVRWADDDLGTLDAPGEMTRPVLVSSGGPGSRLQRGPLDDPRARPC